MSFFTRLLRDDVQVSRELESDEKLLHEDLRKFFQSYVIKQNVLQCLFKGESIFSHLHKLQYALGEELSLIEVGERTEKEIILDLKYISREHYIQKIEELTEKLNHAETKDEYVCALMEELHELILSEARKVNRLSKGETDPSLIQTLTDLLVIEKHIVDKLSSVEDFEPLFEGLCMGTKRRKDLKHVEKRFAKSLRDRMSNVEVDKDGKVRSRDGHYLSELTAMIFNKLENTIMEMVREGMIVEHQNADVEFVNSKFFEEFVRGEINFDRTSGKIVPSERTIEMFVRIFREMYNSQEIPKEAVKREPVSI